MRRIFLGLRNKGFLAASLALISSDILTLVLFVRPSRRLWCVRALGHRGARARMPNLPSPRILLSAAGVSSAHTSLDGVGGGGGQIYGPAFYAFLPEGKSDRDRRAASGFHLFSRNRRPFLSFPLPSNRQQYFPPKALRAKVPRERGTLTSSCPAGAYTFILAPPARVVFLGGGKGPPPPERLPSRANALIHNLRLATPPAERYPHSLVEHSSTRARARP